MISGVLHVDGVERRRQRPVKHPDVLSTTDEHQPARSEHREAASDGSGSVETRISSGFVGEDRAPVCRLYSQRRGGKRSVQQCAK